MVDISISEATAEGGTVASKLLMYSRSVIHGALGENGPCRTSSSSKTVTTLRTSTARMKMSADRDVL